MNLGDRKSRPPGLIGVSRYDMNTGVVSSQYAIMPSPTHAVHAIPIDLSQLPSHPYASAPSVLSAPAGCDWTYLDRKGRKFCGFPLLRMSGTSKKKFELESGIFEVLLTSAASSYVVLCDDNECIFGPNSTTWASLPASPHVNRLPLFLATALRKLTYLYQPSPAEWLATYFAVSGCKSIGSLQPQCSHLYR